MWKGAIQPQTMWWCDIICENVRYSLKQGNDVKREIKVSKYEAPECLYHGISLIFYFNQYVCSI